MEKKINITSTAVEKGLDMARSFLSKLISPAVEEAGLLIKDRITYWRFRNQVKVLNKAQEYCAKNNISTKAISLKLMFPLLENASLEEDDFMQDKWAVLLGNLVDSSQNIENNVFPFILSQISKSEFVTIEIHQRMKREKKDNQLAELNKNTRISEDKIASIKQKAAESTDFFKIRDYEMEIGKIERKLRHLQSEYERPFYFNGSIEEFEIANLVRCGVLKFGSKQVGYIAEKSILNDPHTEYLYIQDVEVDIEGEDYHVLTKLGELFIIACTEKPEQGLAKL